MDGEGTAAPALALGQSIANARRKAGMTQQELCMRANLSYSTLAKIERGAIKTPSVFTVAAIAEATGTSIEALAGIEAHNVPEGPTRDLKTSKTGVKFIYFDVNGVLVRYYQRAFTNIAIDTGCSADTVEGLFWHYNDAACRGDMSMDEFNRVLAERIGVDHISWADYYLANVDPITEIHELAEWAIKHYKVGLLTNIMPGLVRAMIDRDILPNLPYDVIVDSSEVGSIKPEEDIYRKATEWSGCEPHEILLADDSRTNLMAAERIGWRVLWFDDYRSDEGAERIRQMLEFQD